MERSSEVRKQDASGLFVRCISPVRNPLVFKSSKFFETLDKVLKDGTEDIMETDPGIYCLKVKNKEGNEAFWIINASADKCSVTFNGKERPDVTIELDDEDFIDLLSDKLYAPRAYFQGKIRIIGNVGKAMKFTRLLKKVSLMEDLKNKL